MLDLVFEAVGFGLCHQLPERSFFAAGYQLPVCARDTGIYLGFAMGLLVLAAIERRRRPTELAGWHATIVALLFVGVMAVDGLTSYAGLRETDNEIRLATGLLAGWALPLFAVPVLNAELWATSSRGRILGTRGSFLLWLAALPVAWAAARLFLPLLGVGYPVLLTLAILATFTSVNLVLVCLIPAFGRKAERLRDAWLPLLIAVSLTLVELGLASAFRGFTELLARGGFTS